MINHNRTCPTCGTGDGIPKAVTTFRGVVRLGLVCRTCRHGWAIEWPERMPITTPPSQPQEPKAESPHRFFD